MNMQGVNIEEELKKNRVVPNTEELLNQLDLIWEKQHQKDVSLLVRLKEKPSKKTPNNHFNLSSINPKHIFHINDIKKICI